MDRSALHCWLKFGGRFAARPPAYQPWLDDYLDFLTAHRGLAASTRGLRIGEVVRLRLADVDWRRR